MKWNTPKPPRLGDYRIERPFAIWPAKMDDGTRVWLERYEVLERFSGIDWDYLWDPVTRERTSKAVGHWICINTLSTVPCCPANDYPKTSHERAYPE